MDNKKIYFPNLNGLRFIAALLVIIHHIEQIKSIFRLDNYWKTVPFIGIIGKLGVILFFVLSGFLITYLLLAEEHRFKAISIRNFYVRRILRIWPLYFLIVILSFLAFPNIDTFILPGFTKEVVYSNLWLKLILFAIFFPNLVLAFLGVVPFASHTWSIGTEEQFYLAWPVLLKFVKRQRIILMLMIILVYVAINLSLATDFTDFLPYKKNIQSFWSMFNIDCMAIGGIFAILLFQKSKLLNLLQHSILFYGSLILATIMIIAGVYVPFIHYEVYSLLFAIIILNFAANKKLNISLENRVFNYLGNISYGLYMYHPIAIVAALTISKHLNYTDNWLIYTLSFAITTFIAGISYKYYESLFLKFKLRFTKILSGSHPSLQND